MKNLLVQSAIFASATALSHSQTVNTWTGNDSSNNWSKDGNWSGSGRITTGQVARFEGNTNGGIGPFADLGNANRVTLKGLEFGSGDDFTIRINRFFILDGNLSSTQGFQKFTSSSADSPVRITGNRTITTSGSSTISVEVGLSANSALTKNGTGSLRFSGSDQSVSIAGLTTVAEGTLDIRRAINAAGITVDAGATMVGGGEITLTSGSLSVSGTQSAGTLDASGSQTVNGDVSYESGSIFNWNLDDNSTTGGFDKLTINSGTLTTAGSSSNFQIDFGDSVDFSNVFWDQSRTFSWTSIFGDFATNNAFQNATLLTQGAGPDAAVRGSFSLTSAGVEYSAVPEPGSILAGILIGAGFLRRRRVG